MTMCGAMRLKSAVLDLAELLFSFLPASQVSPLPGQEPKDPKRTRGESIFAGFTDFLTFHNVNWIITPPPPHREWELDSEVFQTCFALLGGHWILRAICYIFSFSFHRYILLHTSVCMYRFVPEALTMFMEETHASLLPQFWIETRFISMKKDKHKFEMANKKRQKKAKEMVQGKCTSTSKCVPSTFPTKLFLQQLSPKQEKTSSCKVRKKTLHTAKGLLAASVPTHKY